MKITIITACRNAAKTIAMTLESVRRQGLGTSADDGCIELEHIVVDGASTDGTVDAIREGERLAKSVARLEFRWISEPDRNLYDGINKGIRMATGDVVGIVNADDVLAEDDTLMKIAGVFRDVGVDVVYADVRFVRGGDSVDGMRSAAVVRNCTGRFFRKWMFRFAVFPAHPGTYVRRSCYDRFGLYSLDYPICADFELMLRLFWKHRIVARYLPAYTTVMRIGGLSTNGFRSNVQINREDLRALRANGIWSCLPLIYLKYFAKVWGFVFRGRAR